MNETKSALAWFSALFAMSAAFFWYLSATAKVRQGDKALQDLNNESPEIYAGSTGNEYELVRTLERQSKWSRWAAVAAGLAAVLQGCLQLMA